MGTDDRLVNTIYIVIDHSWSMGPDGSGALDTVNSLIPTIIDSCAKGIPCRFCVIGFGNSAELLSPLTHGANLQTHPVVAHGGSNYSEAFELLRHRIGMDAIHLEADGYESYQPAVFLITDGDPTDDPSSAFAALTDPTWPHHPNISVIGIGKNLAEDAISPYVFGKGRVLVIRDHTEAHEAVENLISGF